MKASVVLTERFQITLTNIAVDLAAVVTRQYAERVVEEILAKSQSLTHMPRRGRVVPEIGDENYRELIVAKRKYRLVYRVSDDAATVEVLFVFFAPRAFPYDDLIDAE